MIQPLELEWLGGAAERCFRRRRPDIDDLPWHELRPADHAPEIVDRARIAWTRNVVSEYAGATGFAAISAALLATRAPVDLCAMAADFVVDELAHVELASRVAMALGGAAPAAVDLGALVPPPDPALPPPTPQLRAAELAVRVSCVSESFSVSALAATRTASPNPLLRAAHALILRDEARHARFGWLYLDWAGDTLTDDDRARLRAAAAHQMSMVAVSAFGEAGRHEARQRLDEHVVPRLARYGLA